MLGIAVPLFNEEQVVTKSIGKIVATLDRLGILYHIMLVNNGSTDSTAAKIDALATHISISAIHLEHNQGYGGGIWAGIEELQSLECKYLGWCWGDGQIDPVVLEPMLQALVNGADIAKSRRESRDDGLKREAISAVYAGIMRVYGVKTPDINGCPKLFLSKSLKEIAPKHRDWVFRR